MANIFEKLKQLEGQYTRDGQDIPGEIGVWSKDVKEAGLFTHLLQFDGMKRFLDSLVHDIEGINDKLASDRNLDDKDRNYWFGQKDTKEEIIKFFKSKEQLIIDTEKRINEELAN